MSTFPVVIDNPSAGVGTTGQPLSNPNHITQHLAQNTAIVALETKVGIDSSAVTSTIDYLLKNTSSSNPGHTHTLSSLSDFNISSPVAGQSLVYNGSKWVNGSGVKFGGTGADGALSITSGTTTINCANAAIVIKNYTSISITGSAKLAFSNPGTNGTIIILKSQGAVTITSSTVPAIDVTLMGAAQGTAGETNQFKSVGAGGNAGTNTGGVAGAAPFNFTPIFISGKSILLGVGGGAGGGGTGTQGSGGGGASVVANGTAGTGTNSGSGTGASGAIGGGCLYIECGGALNITSTLTAAGTNGSNATPPGNGGGGSGGGTIVILYNSLTANSGTYTVTGGTGGTGQQSGGNGGAGYSLVALNTEFA